MLKPRQWLPTLLRAAAAFGMCVFGLVAVKHCVHGISWGLSITWICNTASKLLDLKPQQRISQIRRQEITASNSLMKKICPDSCLKFFKRILNKSSSWNSLDTYYIPDTVLTHQYNLISSSQGPNLIGTFISTFTDGKTKIKQTAQDYIVNTFKNIMKRMS